MECKSVSVRSSDSLIIMLVCACKSVVCARRCRLQGLISRPGSAVVPDRIASPCFASPWSWSGNGCRRNSDNLGSICSSFSQLYFFVAHSARFVFLFSGPANFSQPPGVSFSLRKQKKRTSTGFILYSQPALFIFLIYILFSCIFITHLRS